MRIETSVADIFDECGPGRCPITFPQFTTVHAVIRIEEQRPVHVRQRTRRRTANTAADIFDECGPGGRAVTFPQFNTAHAVIGSEEQRPVYVR